MSVDKNRLLLRCDAARSEYSPRISLGSSYVQLERSKVLGNWKRWRRVRGADTSHRNTRKRLTHPLTSYGDGTSLAVASILAMMMLGSSASFRGRRETVSSIIYNTHTLLSRPSASPSLPARCIWAPGSCSVHTTERKTQSARLCCCR